MHQFKKYIILCFFIIVCGGVMGCSSDLDTKNTNENNVDFKLSGISDYKVVTNDNTPLQNSTTKTPLDELGRLALTLQGRSSRQAFLEDLPSITYLELRDVGDIQGSHVYYCVFAQDFNKLYLFVDVVPACDNQLVIFGTCCKNRDLSFQDFDTIKPDFSTIQDVEKIDPVMKSLPYCSCIDGFPSISCEDGRTTLHMTKEGFVEITYQEKKGKTLVKSVKKKSSQMIKKINSLDL